MYDYLRLIRMVYVKSGDDCYNLTQTFCKQCSQNWEEKLFPDKKISYNVKNWI